jgi:hypothetical protein
MLMRVLYLNYQEAGLCCYLAIHIHYSCFTCISDLFTDSSSYKKTTTNVDTEEEHYFTEEGDVAVNLWACIRERRFVRIRAGTPAILIEIFHSFLSPSRKMSGYYHIQATTASFQIFPVHYLSFILTFDTAYS